MSNYNKVKWVGSGSYEHLRTSSGRCFFFCAADGNPDLVDVVVFEHHDDECPEAGAYDCACWAEAIDLLTGYVPADDLDAIDAYLKEHESEFYWGD